MIFLLKSILVSLRLASNLRENPAAYLHLSVTLKDCV